MSVSAYTKLVLLPLERCARFGRRSINFENLPDLEKHAILKGYCEI